MPDNDFTPGENTTVIDLARTMVELNTQKKDAKKVIELIQERINETQEALVDIMTNEQIDKLSVNGMTVYPKTNLYASMNKENKQGAMYWLSENGYADLVQKTVNARTLAATVKGIRADGGNVPEDLFNVNEITTIGIKKA